MVAAGHTVTQAGEAQEILSALFRWSWGFDGRDLTLARSAFTVDRPADARFVVRSAPGTEPTVHEGIDAIVALFSRAFASRRDARHHIMANPLVERTGDGTARVRTVLLLTIVADGALRVQSTGVYEDTVVRERDGTWRILSRELTLDNPAGPLRNGP